MYWSLIPLLLCSFDREVLSFTNTYRFSLHAIEIHKKHRFKFDINSENGDNSNSPGLQHQRRKRYSGKYPRNFDEKYKEQRHDEQTIQKVLAKGMTPAGQHVPIMVKECLYHMGLEGSDDRLTHNRLLVVDCTLGYGGHSEQILKKLLQKNDGSRLIAFDQDPLEIAKTEERLRHLLRGKSLLSPKDLQDITNQPILCDDIFCAINQNFQTLGSYLSASDDLGKVTNLLADLGLSSMQIDDNSRGFTYKREGPLDMRMNPEENTESAYDLLKRLRVRQLKSILKENSDEPYSHEIAKGLIGAGAKIPESTLELAERVRDILQPLLQKEDKRPNRKEADEMKRAIDSTVARVMQAIRIEVNSEFQVLDKLLGDLPGILAPGGRTVFLTFHSGEDRRVKKSFKSGYKSGIYSSWSDEVVRPTKEERRNNPRSSCCKLRWAIRSESDFEINI